VKILTRICWVKNRRRYSNAHAVAIVATTTATVRVSAHNLSLRASLESQPDGNPAGSFSTIDYA
jgi:hypothetical protein